MYGNLRKKSLLVLLAHFTSTPARRSEPGQSVNTAITLVKQTGLWRLEQAGSSTAVSLVI